MVIVLKFLKKSNSEKPIIFITAYNDYAIKAFEFNGIHYLLKPINYKMLTSAFVKFERNELKTSKMEQFDFKAEIEPNHQKRFMSKIGNKLKVVETQHILLFYTDTGLVYAKTFDDCKYVIDDTLENIIKKISFNHFFRINRQMILNIDGIEDMRSYSSNRLKIKLKCDHHQDVIVSKDKSAKFKDWLASH